MRRREFMGLLGGVAAAWPLAARAPAQQPLPVIGYLSSASQAIPNERVGMFVKALKAAGFEDDRNVTIQYRFAEGHLERLAAFAADLVKRQVRVIVVPDSVPSAKAAQAATSTIPIVFGVGADPVRAGLVASLNHPGGNLTGMTRMNLELVPKRLQILHELVPAARTLALLVNADNPNAMGSVGAMQEGARSIGIQLTVVSANRETGLDRAFSEIVSAGAGGVAISPDPFFFCRMCAWANLRSRTGCPQSSNTANSRLLAGSQAMAAIPMRPTASWPSMQRVSSRARSPPTCRCNNMLASNLSSTSRPRRRSA
jgi:putative ABC transport system substrate-binding protein